MINVTVKSLAAEIQIPVKHLVQQFADVGINKTEADYVTQKEKEILITYLNRKQGSKPNKLILQRKTRSTLNILSTSGKNKSVQIEIRKKHTYIPHAAQLYEHANILKQDINKTKEILHYQKQHNDEEKKQYGIREKAKRLAEDKAMHKAAAQAKRVVAENDKSLTQYQTNIITKSLQAAKKARRDADVAELRRKSEEEARRKIEEKSRQIAEEVRRMAEECCENWDNASDSVEEDITNYHITTSYHARKAEDENDHKIEGERRNRVGKGIKQKKTSRLFESKADREEARVIGRNSKKVKRNKISALTQCFSKPVKTVIRDVVIGETITVAELANKMAVKGSHVVKTMMKLGAMVTINQIIDQETAQLVVEEMGHKAILHHDNELEELLMSDRNIDNCIIKEARAPVVTIMGHVDHGKTSLLDYIRSTKVALGEAGGITQHIGAYHIKINNGMITFLDTPGHAAFTAMRARGAQVTDIVVLVVAADDGVMPQTIEAIQHAKAAKVPVIVAINKIDKLQADPERVKNELTKYGIIPDDWGGDSQFIYVSAKSGIGIDKLLDAILLQSEILELKTNRNSMANGTVIESFLDKGHGPVATVLVRDGILNRGDIILCGFEYGRIRAMRDQIGRYIISAHASIPVEILGLSGVPVVGDKVTVVRDEKKARELALYRQGKFREVKLARQQKSKLENIFNTIDGKIPELNIVLKSDVQGTAEAIVNVLTGLSNDKIKINIIGSGVGSITETDAVLAAASNAILLGFNVRADTSARRIIEEEHLNLQYHSIIYHLVDEIKKTIGSILIPEYKRKIIGIAEVRNIFNSLKFGTIAGCMVIEGILKRNSKIRILRENIAIYEGELESLRRFKDDVNEVRNGMECGIVVKNYNDIRSGDVLEAFETTAIQRVII